MDHGLTLVVSGLAVAGAGAGWAAVEVLRRRRRASLGAKLFALFVGLAAAEAALTPAFVVAVAGEDWTALRGGGFEPWLVGALYVAIAFYVLARLFPWRDVEALAADPDARLRDVIARLRAADKSPNDEP